MRVFENDEVSEYIVAHHLQNRYLKARSFLESGNFRSVDFKKRQPKQADMYQFRITEKYRALCYFRGGDVYVFDINDHQ